MCGLIVAWDPAGLEDAPIRAALADIRHRGPDAQSTVFRENRRLQLAHTRLKIIDISDDANQPFVSPDERWALVYNGEIFNFRELRNEIGDRWPWRTHGDTEVLLAAWTLWGAECLHRFVGMFAFAIHDAERHTVTLVRDRFGIKPLYRVTEGTRRVYASEIPPLLRFQSNISADRSTIRTYLELGLYDHGEHTFFEGIRALSPGHLTEIDLRSGEERTARWYRLAAHVTDLTGIPETELINEAERLAMQAVSSHLVSDVAVGLNVSGGVDSSMLTRASIAELGAAHLFTQDYPDYSEEPWVREISEGGILHISKLSFPDIDRLLAPVTGIQAEPYGGVTVCGYDALYEQADRQGITVLLDGNGVDECFLGYERYHQAWVWAAAEEEERLHRLNEFHRFWGHDPVDHPGATGVAIDGTVSTCTEAVAPVLRSTATVRPSPSFTDFSCPVKNLAAADLLHNKIPRGLRFNDRMSMAHSKELRVPFLDHRLVEFAYGVPSAFLLGAGGSKQLFRKVAARHMPSSVAFSAKRSVQSPQREWLANEWRVRVDDILKSDSFGDRQWIDPGAAKRAWDRYLGGNRSNSFPIWQWINLELWSRCFLDHRRVDD